MKKILLAFALVALLLLSGCTKTLSGNIGDQLAYCRDVDTLKIKIERDRCLHNVATLHYNNPQAADICAEITAVSAVQWMDDMVTKNIRNDCYYQVAMKRAGIGDASAVQLCDKIKGGTTLDSADPTSRESGNMLLRDQCFYEVAVAVQIEAYCDYINDEAVKEYGYDISFDPSSGAEIRTPRLIKFKDLCKQEVPP